jgi:hypothetical protein
MNDRSFQDILLDVFKSIEHREIDDDNLREIVLDKLPIVRTCTFHERGVLTRNKGLIVELANGDEFQITIVQSERGVEDELDEDEEE